MIGIREAIAILAEKFPDKRIDSNPVQIDDIITFHFVDKDASKERAMWDHTVVGVNQITGEISWHDAFDEDVSKRGIRITEY